MQCEIGIRAHDIQIFDNTEKLAFELDKYGLKNIQFSPKFSLQKETTNGYKMCFGLASHTRKIFDEHHINIVVLGCYINMINSDLNQRNIDINLFKQYLAYAKSFDCPIVATETGSINNIFTPQKINWTNEIFTLTVQKISDLIKTAEKLGVLVGIEPGVNHPIHDIETTKKLIEEVNSPNLKIIFDPTNLVLHENDSIIQILKDGIKEFGDYIYAFHIKDYKFKDGQKVIAPLGAGLVPIDKVSDIIKEYRNEQLVLMEETPQDNFDRSVKRFKHFFI